MDTSTSLQPALPARPTGPARRDRSATPSDSTAPLWVLHGARHGDNQLLSAIARELGLPYRVIALRFGKGSSLPWLPWLGTHLAWHADEPLQGPWPRAVLAAGRKSVAAARWIQRHAGGAVRLIHLNRPRAPLAWFDLVVTTPQFMLPPRPNVACSLLPFLGPLPEAEPLPASWLAAAERLPRPWAAVLVGGDSPPYVLDEAAAARIAATVDADVARHGGGAWVLAGPRTPPAALHAIARRLTVPAQLVPWRQLENPYRALRGLADRFVVTGDSASMLTEALLTGRPVRRVELSRHPGWRWRLAGAWRAAAERSPGSWLAQGFEAAVAAGLLTSVKDMERLHESWRREGLLDGSTSPRAVAETEARGTLERIRRLVDRRAVPRPEPSRGLRRADARRDLGF